MIKLANDYKKAIENTALAAGTITGIVGALTGSGGLSAIALVPAVIEKIVIAGYDHVSPAVSRQLRSSLKETYRNVEKRLRSSKQPNDLAVLELLQLVSFQMESQANDYTLQGVMEEIYNRVIAEAKWNALSLTDRQQAELVKIIVNEFINQSITCDELSNYLNSNGLLLHEARLIDHEKTLSEHGKELERQGEQLLNLNERVSQQIEGSSYVHMSSSELQDSIFAASCKEYDQLHVENNKFHGLRIYEKLFPRGYELPRYYEGYGSIDNEQIIPLRQIYATTGNHHIALLGEGGIGKTTFLAHLMEQLLFHQDNKLQVPVYVELNKCPGTIGKWFSSKYGKSDFVTRYIASAITEEEFDNIDSKLLTSIESLLRNRPQNQEKPTFVLLLDGLNEVSRNVADEGNDSNWECIRDILEHEISVLATYNNVRIILTSRKIDRGYIPKGLTYIGLRGLKTADILDHLNECGFSKMEINSIKLDPELLEILRIPLFLCMYASNGTVSHIRPSTRGEILCDFFHRTGDYYGERKNIDDRYGKTVFEKTQLSFIMNFILPYIGNVMEGSYVFSISLGALRDCIRKFFIDENIPFWNERTSLFPEFEKGRTTLYQLYLKMKDIPDMEIVDCVVNTLGVMTRDSKQCYSFIHQHVRDYFSAYYEVQCLRSASGLWKADEEDLYDDIIDSLGSIYYDVWEKEKHIFVGEILREHRNSPILGPDSVWQIPGKETPEQELLSDILDIFRYRYQYVGYTLYNIVEIMKHSRKNLAGIRFDGLDLSECRLYGASFALGEQKPLRASFRDTIIQDETVLPEGHLQDIMGIEVSRDGATLYSIGSDKSVKIWDVMQDRCVSTHDVGSYCFNPTQADRHYLVPDDNLGFLIKHYEFEELNQDSYTGEELEDEDRNQRPLRSEIRYYTGERKSFLSYAGPELEDAEIIPGIWDMCFDPDGELIAGLWEYGFILLYDKKKKDHIACISVAEEGIPVRIAMPDRNTVYVNLFKDSTDGELRIESVFAILKLNVCWTEDGSCFFEKPEEIFRYTTVYDCNSQIDFPAFDFSYDGHHILFYSEELNREWGPSVIMRDLRSGKMELIMRTGNDIPESAEFVSNHGILVHWEDMVALYLADTKQSTVYHNENLSECRRLLTTTNESYILTAYNSVLRWSMLQGTTEEALSQPRVDIDGFNVEPSTGLINVEFADSSILRLNTDGTVIGSIYYPEYDLKLESSWYLVKADAILSVFQGEGFEKILIHHLITGLTRQIHLDFIDNIAFRSACELEDGVLLGFDTKLVFVHAVNEEAQVIWQSSADEKLISVEVDNDRIYLLKESIEEREKGGIPGYLVFKKTGGKYSFSQNKPAILVAESDMVLFLNDGLGSEQYCIKNDDGIVICQERGVFLQQNDSIKKAFEKSGLNPFDLHTVFYEISDYRKNCVEKFAEGSQEMVMDITNRYILASDMLSGLKMYRIDESKTVLTAEINVKEKDDGSNCAVRNAVIGDPEGRFIYCDLGGMTVAGVNTADGLIQWKRRWIPGINIMGCDFSGVTYTSEVEKLLEIMGVLQD